MTSAKHLHFASRCAPNPAVSIRRGYFLVQLRMQRLMRWQMGRQQHLPLAEALLEWLQWALVTEEPQAGLDLGLQFCTPLSLSAVHAKAEG